MGYGNSLYEHWDVRLSTRTQNHFDLQQSTIAMGSWVSLTRRPDAYLIHENHGTLRCIRPPKRTICVCETLMPPVVTKKGSRTIVALILKMALQSLCKLHMFVIEWPIINQKIKEKF